MPRLFYESAVELIELEGTNRLLDGGTIRTIWSVYERGLKPYERIYKVDLSKKKTQIMKEFKGYLDRAYLRNEEESNWAPYKKRNRDEAWDHLKVWILRKKRKSFSEIAQALNITTEAAKKSFYRAYELIYWEKYDPVLFKRDYWEIRQRDIARQCKSCHSHPNNGGDCTELCPDVLPYVDQDEIKQRELLVEQRAVNILDKKSKTKTVIKKKAISLNKATACPKCNTTFQEALESLGSKLCPFCHKKIST